MERRTLLQIMLALCATGASTPFYAAASKQEHESILNDDARAFLHQLCDLIIPDTDSPGAIKAGVLERFDFVLSHMSQEERQYWLTELASVQSQLNKFTNGVFTSMPKQQQVLLLDDFDQLAYQQSPPATTDAYRQLKKEIASAYYTTEMGMTRELRYMPVPGKWEACIPFSDVGRTWAK